MIYDAISLKQQKKYFDDIAGTKLLSEGFKKGKGIYWRVVNENIFQCATLVNLDGSYNIFFDMLPMYGAHSRLNLGCSAKDIPSRNLSYALNQDSLLSQLEYFCRDIIPAFNRVVSDESLYEFIKQWIQIESDYYESDLEEYEEKEEKELERATNDIVMKNYAFVKTNADSWLDDSGIYAALKCKDYETALEEILDKYYYRLASEELSFNSGEISFDELKERLNRVERAFAQDLEIKEAIEQKKYEVVERILQNNFEKNINAIKKILNMKKMY